MIHHRQVEPSRERAQHLSSSQATARSRLGSDARDDQHRLEEPRGSSTAHRLRAAWRPDLQASHPPFGVRAGTRFPCLVSACGCSPGSAESYSCHCIRDGR